MKVAVIGGSGFVGSVLTTLLTPDHEATVIDIAPPSDRSAATYIEASVTESDELEAATKGIDVIVNLAAVHRDDVRPRSRYDEVNVGGARSVCEVARRNGVERLVFTSSVAVYGFAAGETDENGPLNYFNDYGRTKAEAEDVYREWASESDSRSLTIVRPTVIFGEGNRGNVYNLLRQLVSQRFVMIGNGENRKSMAYVENVAAFLRLCLSHGPGVHLYNYVDKPDLTMNELVTTTDLALGRADQKRARIPCWLAYAGGLIFDVLGWVLRRTFPISAIRVRKFCANTVFAADRVRESGYRPPFSLEAALFRTIKHEFPAARNAASRSDQADA